jgi:hypothetical protein
MILQLERCRVVFPDWYDERAEYEAELKGWLQGVEVELGDGSRYPVLFYDPVRLAQDLEEEAKWDRPFIAEPGMIVIPTVTRATISQAVEQLAAGGFFGHFRPTVPA